MLLIGAISSTAVFTTTSTSTASKAVTVATSRVGSTTQQKIWSFMREMTAMVKERVIHCTLVSATFFVLCSVVEDSSVVSV